jgi:hypothetical protein
VKSIRKAQSWAVAALLLASACTVNDAHAQLHWQSSPKEQIRVRLVALAVAYPRSTFFSSEEVFIAEKQLDQNESRLVKLVYGFLPYQPRLSEKGLNYSMLHELVAVRDPTCDETLAQMNATALGRPSPSDPAVARWRYSADSPGLKMDRHRASLPCYLTSADDYGKPISAPTGDSTPPPPSR